MITTIREYAEGEPVEIKEIELSSYGAAGTGLKEGDKRVVIQALNEGGYSSTSVDLLDVIAWVKENKPQLLEDGGSGWQLTTQSCVFEGPRDPIQFDLETPAVASKEMLQGLATLKEQPKILISIKCKDRTIELLASVSNVTMM